jgi:ABC-type Na+ efflux pump permease subunit
LQEKKSGALELILVSPLTVDQIVFGRVWGLWKLFLPALLVAVGSDISLHGRFLAVFSGIRTGAGEVCPR